MKVVDMSVELLDSMGNDLSIVNAARVSFNKVALEFTDKDAKLIHYLAKHNHWSPFAHTSLSFRIKAPIFVARQLAKHQVGGAWNEVSRRYVDSDVEFYFPKHWRKKAENVKQGSSDEVVEDLAPARYAVMCVDHCMSGYKKMIEAGYCAEQARMILPQNTMTTWIWTGSLAFFARVCKLRLDSHTQRETQEIARMLEQITREKFPVGFKALMEN